MEFQILSQAHILPSRHLLHSKFFVCHLHMLETVFSQKMKIHMAWTLITGFTVFTELSPHFLMVPYVHLSQWIAGSERQQTAAEATPALLSLLSITSLLSAWHSPAHSLVDLVPSGAYSTQLFWNTFSSPYPRPQLFHSQDNWSSYRYLPFPSFHSFSLKKWVCGFGFFFSLQNIITK